MAITSYGYDGTVLEAGWAKLSGYLGKTYAVGSTADWLVTAVAGSDRTVKVAVGDGFGRGVLDVSNTEVTLQAAVLASGVRWDTVIARRTWATNTTVFLIITGTATLAIAAGLNANPGVVDDQVLALVQITAGQTVPTEVIDLRPPFSTDTSEVGTVKEWYSAVAPAGYLLLQGQQNIRRAQYPKLFALYGTLYGAGDGVTTFGLPNPKGKVMVSLDPADLAFDVVGETGGAKTHTLTANEIPSHVHGVNHAHTASSANTGTWHDHDMGHGHGRQYGATYGGAGSHAHSNNIGDAGGLGGGGTLIRKGYAGGGEGSSAAGGHDHSAYIDIGWHAQNTGANGITHAHGVTVDANNFNATATGGGAAHNIVQPYIVAHRIVKAA